MEQGNSGASRGTNHSRELLDALTLIGRDSAIADQGIDIQEVIERIEVANGDLTRIRNDITGICLVEGLLLEVCRAGR